MNFTLNHYAVMGSTNDEARRFMLEGAPEGTVVRADRQTAGRGRQGRSWISDEGNLFFSIILSPNCPISDANQLSFVMAHAVGEALMPLLASPSSLSYKWPNDMMLEDRKVGGILIEAESKNGSVTNKCIAGIGLNLISSPDEVAYPTAALKDFTEKDIDLESIFLGVLDQIRLSYRLWQEEGFDPIRNKWLSKAYALGKPVCVSSGRRKICGEFVGMNEEGYLMLRDDQGAVITLASAEILK